MLKLDIDAGGHAATGALQLIMRVDDTMRPSRGHIVLGLSPR